MNSTPQTEEERRIDTLRAFEREYRLRLKAYLDGQLRDVVRTKQIPPVSAPPVAQRCPGHEPVKIYRLRELTFCWPGEAERR